MVLYICHFCNYSSYNKNKYYNHNYKHLTSENIDSFTPEEIQLCNYYKDFKTNREKEYYEKNIERLTEYKKEYYEKNKERLTEYKKEYNKKYRQRKKMTKQDE